MTDVTEDPREDIARIRELMDRARDFRYLPPAGAFLAGAAAVGGALLTHRLAPAGLPAEALPRLGALWAGVFLVAAACHVGATWDMVRREGGTLFTPLARDILHALWPPCLVAVALTVLFAAEPGLAVRIPALWMLCYGSAGIAAASFSLPVVRCLGAAFLAAGLVCLARPLPASWSLGLTFGGFHLVYGLALLRRKGG